MSGAVSALVDALRGAFGGRIEPGAPLAPLTTYRLGGPAALLVEPSSEGDLVVLARKLKDAPGVPVLPLGRGSNLLISDKGFDGVVVRFGGSLSDLSAGGESGVVAGAGVPLPVLANHAARRGLSGLEFCVAVPGSVGGAVRMNAGAHGGQISDTLAEVRVVALEDADVTVVAAEDLELGYRRSKLTERHWVSSARFELERSSEADVRARMETCRRHRAETQPPPVANAGSTFKNPPGDHAGRLVDAAGLKGFRVGGVRVSELHANFFVADETATAQDVFDLVAAVRAKVRDAFGVDLEPEVRFVGHFTGGGAES